MKRATKKPAIILHNLRSTHNVGAILRTAACFGDFEVYCTGTTPYPAVNDDIRLPHLAAKQTAAVAKTALGAEDMLTVRHDHIGELIARLKSDSYHIVACEQTQKAVALTDWQPVEATALVFGNEPNGIDDELLALCDRHIEIPMTGQKSSLNVASAAAITLHYWATFGLSTGPRK